MAGVVHSMTTAISGLAANGEMLSVISDNIVNANTTGFKGARTEFQNVLAADLNAGGGAGEIGSGVKMAGVTNIFTQGSITRTERGTDLALNGNGFFLVKGANEGVNYTRDGGFRFDKEGWLTSLGGQRVQAFQATPEGRVTGTVGDVRLPLAGTPAKPTGKIDMQMNLDARVEPTVPFNPERPDESSQFVTALSVYDSVGNAHSLNVYFNKNGENAWEWHAMGDGGEVLGGEKGKMTEIAGGQLVFDQVGKLYSAEQKISQVTFANGAVPDQNLEFSFGDPIANFGTGISGTTQYGSKSNSLRTLQDGFSAGVILDTQIDQDGVLTGVYSNGQNKVLGQLAVARFDAPERLSRAGDNQFKETQDSGVASVGKARTTGRGSVMTKSLEGSNVDLAKEFVEMIKSQRGFQASAKSISTSNEMLEEVINLRGR